MEFKSMREAAKELGVPFSSLRRKLPKPFKEMTETDWESFVREQKTIFRSAADAARKLNISRATLYRN